MPDREGAIEKNDGRISIMLPTNAGKADLAELVYSHLHPDPKNLQHEPVGGKTVDTVKTTWKITPEQLEIQLKRFNNNRQKNSVPVDVPMKLPLPKHLFDDQDKTDSGFIEYQLFATVIHHGESIQNGHYTALTKLVARDGIHNLSADDSHGNTPGATGRMIEITDQNYAELAKQGYIFVYRKVDPTRGLIPSSPFASQLTTQPSQLSTNHSQPRQTLNDRLSEEELENIQIYQETYTAANTVLKGQTVASILGTERVDANFTKAAAKPNGVKDTPIYVMNKTTADMARDLYKNGYNPLVQIMANPTIPGGGVKNGRTAQEEIIWRQSNVGPALLSALNRKLYPISDASGIFVPKGIIFRGDARDGYKEETPFPVDFFASAAINGADLINTPAEVALTKEKIRVMLRKAIQNGNDSLVLGAFGCGAFHNNPNKMAEFYRIY